jgi:hypothetical protein
MVVSIKLKSLAFNKSPTEGIVKFLLKSVILTTVSAVLDWYQDELAKFANSSFKVCNLEVATSILDPTLKPLLDIAEPIDDALN